MNKQLMSEAEVSLLLAIHLISSNRVSSDIEVALDGAHIKIGSVQRFDVKAFLGNMGWLPEQPSDRWQARYVTSSSTLGIVVHSKSGVGDITATLSTGELLIVESKKGSLDSSKSSSEYPLLREALGQLLTLDVVPPNAHLAVAVPDGERFRKLAARWRVAPLVQRVGIRILTVSPDGDVAGW